MSRDFFYISISCKQYFTSAPNVSTQYINWIFVSNRYDDPLQHTIKDNQRCEAFVR